MVVLSNVQPIEWGLLIYSRYMEEPRHPWVVALTKNDNPYV